VASRERAGRELEFRGKTQVGDKIFGVTDAYVVSEVTGVPEFT
jgi:hypothetical protein